MLATLIKASVKGIKQVVAMRREGKSRTVVVRWVCDSIRASSREAAATVSRSGPVTANGNVDNHWEKEARDFQGRVWGKEIDEAYIACSGTRFECHKTG